MAGDPRRNSREQSGAGQPLKLVKGSELQPNDQPPISNSSPFQKDQDVVIVRQLPEKLNSDEGHAFFCQMQKLLIATQPHFVFDLTEVRELDSVGIHLLLQCLEEVLKLNGDVKLAAVQPGPAAILEATGVDRLFEIFDRPADAAHSFLNLPRLEGPIEARLNESQARSHATTVAYATD